MAETYGCAMLNQIIYKSMRKKRDFVKPWDWNTWRRELIIPKLFVGLLFLAMPFDTYAQERTKVTLDLKNVTLNEMFEEMKKQTDYDFFYNSQLLRTKGTVSVKAESEEVTQVLDRILPGVNLEYKLNNHLVTIRAKEETKTLTSTQVTGQVQDEAGNPLPGVAVVLKGTTIGVASDVDGKLSLEIPSSQSVTLVFSFVGMKTQEIVYTGQPELNVVMVQKASKLDDVVVIGYQVIKREDATGSFSTVRSEDLEKRYADNLLENLEGRIPGLLSYNTGLNDDGEKTLSIIGVSTFTNNTSPLVVVDGLPIEGSIDDVNPNDIASINVLKDAAAASIYGARASNGVIVITTKTGKYDKVEVAVSADFTINQKVDYSYLNYLNASEQVDLESQLFTAAYANTEFAPQLGMLAEAFTHGYLTPVFSLYNQHYNGTITDSDLAEGLEDLKKNDFLRDYEEHALKNEFVQRYNVALRGKMGMVASDLVFNFRNSNSGIIHAYERTANLSYKGSFPVMKKLTLNFGANVNMDWKREHNSAYALNPFCVPAYTALFTEDGERNYYSTPLVYAGDNAIISNSVLKSMEFNHLDELERDFINTTRVSSRYFLHALVSLIDGLGVSGQFQYEDIYLDQSGLSEAESYTARYLYNVFVNQDNVPVMPDGDILKKQKERGTYYTFRAQANFTRNFQEKHAVTALAGMEIRKTKYRVEHDMLLGYDEDLLTNQMGHTDLNTMREMEVSALFPMRNGSAPSSVYLQSIEPNFGVSETRHNYVSYYANANYVYDGKYSVFASYRQDLTDLFGADPKFRRRPLWSVGLSWNIQNENFMSEIRGVDMMKLRMSYGLTGNIDQNTSSYMTASTSINQYTGERWSVLNAPPNDQLRWEKTATFNLGLDFAFWYHRVSGSLDWYRKYSTDLLTTTPLDPSEGFASLTINNGEALNTGIELALEVDWLREKRNSLGWQTSVNLGYNKNEIKKIEVEPLGMMSMVNSQALVEDRPIRALYSCQYAGLDDTGDILWRLADGTTTKASPATFSAEDAVYSGTIDPKVTLGFENEWSYKGIALSAMFMYYGGNKMRADQWTNCGLSYLGYGYTGELPRYMLEGWTPEHTDTDVPGNGLYAPASGTYTYMKYADRFVVDAAFLKLRNVTLSYDFPDKVCQKLKLAGLKLRVQGNNLWTWVKNDLGVDPEANNPFMGGRSLKQTPSCTFSLNINLYAQTYEKITAYNVLISQIGDVEGDAARKGQLVAEAKTLRAWCHWILVNVFARAYTPERINEGGIPYVTDVNFEEVNEKLSLGKVYEKLLEDLSEENLSLLPDVPENIQRVGKAFGYAVKAKVLLSMQDYAGALQAAETALSFNSNIEDRRGYIGGTPVKTRDAANNLFFAPGSYAAPVWNVISAEWAQLYEQGDILRYLPDLYTDASATQGIEGCYTWENGTEYVYNSSGMRVEDMILVKAECQAREKDIEGAMNTLNDLRRYRVHPDAYQLLEAETETEAMEYIIRAALIEHLFTYTNFFDLKRWNTEDVYKRNITRTVNGVTYTLVPDSPYWVIPFPTDATQYNSSLTQNF